MSTGIGTTSPKYMLQVKPIGDLIVDEARTWLNTRWVHQGRLKGVGVDCAGFIVGVAEAVKVMVDPDAAAKVGNALNIPANYKRRENGQELIRLLRAHMRPAERQDIKRGDVIALIEPGLREPTVPRHLAFATEVGPGAELRIIHASEHGVKEHRTNAMMRKRIHSVWRLEEEYIGE